MTLSRNMAVKLTGLVLAVAALVGVTLNGLNQLQRHTADQLARLDQWRQQYQTFVHSVGSALIEARLALDQSQNTAAGDAADHAATEMARLHWPDDAPAELTEAAQRVQRALGRIAGQLHNGQPDAQVQADLADAYSLAAKLASQMRIVSESITAQTQQLIRQLLWQLALLGGIIIIAAIVLSIWQHRGVMRPLSQLTEGVRRLEAGRFDQRVSERGPAELAALAADFNRMADRLQRFYENLEQQVRDKSRQLAQAERLASVGYLAAGVAHEINNPLGIIAAHAELALRKTSENDPAAKALRVVVEEAFRCKQITQRLLSLSRGSQERHPVSLKALAEQMTEMVRQLPRAKDKTMQVEANDPLMARADASEMKQVLLNLLLNALDASPAPGSKENGCVTIRGRREDAIVVLEVIDNGRGMSAATLAKVFEPFYTEKKGYSAPNEQSNAHQLPGPGLLPGAGAGLGLSISHAIVAEHGGTLSAASAGEGRGSTFTLRLPAI